MAPDPHENPASPVERLFEALLARDGAGGSWLGPLIREAPRGRARFGELADAPGWLEAPVAVRTETGRRGAFEHPAAPSRRLLEWYIDHPDDLQRMMEDSAPETRRLRRALFEDDPPGVRARAQDRARDLVRGRAPLGPVWWRFEEARAVDCLLRTPQLVLVVHERPEGPTASAATPWFPRRSGLVRDLEAAQRFAGDGVAWGVLVLSREGAATAPPEGDCAGTTLADELAAGTPHLTDADRRALAEGYLGELSFARAAAVTGLDAAAAA